MTVIVSLVVALALFAVAYVSRRRFGIMGLALTAGALLSSQMTSDLSGVIAQSKLPIEPLSALSAASILLILLPALVLLFGGPHYKKRNDALVGAVEFTIMAMLLILDPLTSSLPADKLMQPLLVWVMSYKNVLLAFAIAAAIVDVWMIHLVPPSDDVKKKK